MKLPYILTISHLPATGVIGETDHPRPQRETVVYLLFDRTTSGSDLWLKGEVNFEVECVCMKLGKRTSFQCSTTSKVQGFKRLYKPWVWIWIWTCGTDPLSRTRAVVNRGRLLAWQMYWGGATLKIFPPANTSPLLKANNELGRSVDNEPGSINQYFWWSGTFVRISIKYMTCTYMYSLALPTNIRLLWWQRQ